MKDPWFLIVMIYKCASRIRNFVVQICSTKMQFPLKNDTIFLRETALFGPEGPTLNELADPGPRSVIAFVRVALQKVVVRIDRGQQNLV